MGKFDIDKEIILSYEKKWLEEHKNSLIKMKSTSWMKIKIQNQNSIDDEPPKENNVSVSAESVNLDKKIHKDIVKNDVLDKNIHEEHEQKISEFNKDIDRNGSEEAREFHPVDVSISELNLSSDKTSDEIRDVTPLEENIFILSKNDIDKTNDSKEVNMQETKIVAKDDNMHEAEVVLKEEGDVKEVNTQEQETNVSNKLQEKNVKTNDSKVESNSKPKNGIKSIYYIEKNNEKKRYEIMKDGGKRISFITKTKKEVYKLIKSSYVFKKAIIIDKSKKENTTKAISDKDIIDNFKKNKSYVVKFNDKRKRWEIFKEGSKVPVFTSSTKKEIMNKIKRSNFLKNKNIVFKKKENA